MALFVPGMSCGLCGTPIEAGAEIVMFAPFVPNRADPLFLFSDGVFHAACVAGHPLAARAAELQEAARRSFEPRSRVCAACGQAILDPDDYFGAGMLTSDPAHPAFELNFLHLHRGHPAGWSGLAEFRRRVEELQASPAWTGPKIVFGAPPEVLPRWVR